MKIYIREAPVTAPTYDFYYRINKKDWWKRGRIHSPQKRPDPVPSDYRSQLLTEYFNTALAIFDNNTVFEFIFENEIEIGAIA